MARSNARIARMGRTGPVLVLLVLAAALLVLALLPAGADAASSNTGWSLRIREAACVEGERVRLGDIAEPVGRIDLGVWRELAEQTLWQGPQYSGRQQALPRRQIARMLEYYVPEVADACVLPGRLVVQRGGRVFEGRTLQRLVVDFLTPRAASLGGDPEVKDVRVPSFIFLDDPFDKLEVALSNDLRPGRVTMLIRAVGQDGRITRRVAASAFVNLWKAVPCAAQPINRYDSVTPDKIQFMRKNLAYLGEVWDGRSGGPYRMTRSVGTGRPLEMEFLESEPMVSRGDQVNLVYRGPRITLAVKAEALADGDQGQTVEVRNLQSSKTVLATVVDRNTVMVR
ncbi:MAG: flagellar basal body P-ring formation chaperone FlgA [Desulfovibrio sp.]